MTGVLLRGVVALAISLTLGACAVTSSQIQYLQLSAGNVPLPERDGLRVLVDAVSLPDYLLRDELLERDSAFALRYRIDQRWAEPLDLGVQRVLGRRLAAELNTRQLVLFPQAPRGIPDWELSVTVRRFDMRGDDAVLAASGVWTRRGSGVPDDLRAVKHVDFEATHPLTSSDAQAAIALSELLWQFAAALAAPLRADGGS